MTEANPYEPPQTAPAAPLANKRATGGPSPPARYVAIACYPLPFLASLIAWFAYPFMLVAQPLPVIQGIVWIVSTGYAVSLTRTLTANAPAGAYLFAAFAALHVLAILATLPLGVAIYSALGFPDPIHAP